MKYVVCVPDGCADEPCADLDGRTPLEAAAMPTLTGLAKRGEVGRATVIPEGLPPGSDVGNLSILGYDPAVHHTGRAPIEAAALGLTLRPDQVAFRCNLVTVRDGVMADFAGGHPRTEDAAEVVAALQASLGTGEVSFHPGVEYRHVVVAPAAWADARCTPPHDLSDEPAVLPTGPAGPRLQELMEASVPVVSGAPGDATQIWLWGQGTQPVLPSFAERWGQRAALNTAVDLIRGLGVLTGIEVVEAEGVTAGYDTSYEAARDVCLEALGGGADLFLIHVEATDEAGHAGDLTQKVRALEHWDRRILAPLLDGLDDLGPWRLLLLPDHATPVARKTHTSDPVPWVLVDSGHDGPGGVYSEAATALCPPVPGHELMGRLLGREPTT
ncbi:MAG: 2,3-bisphosphoglycerate-independent phosphoglycerate mutase [Acidimicrobiia bacterium]|nr:2,3-bisphosphoglycerate-independent phosphoglycerate mutase [Acidimicrobiia bacterium]